MAYKTEHDKQCRLRLSYGSSKVKEKNCEIFYGSYYAFLLFLKVLKASNQEIYSVSLAISVP